MGIILGVGTVSHNSNTDNNPLLLERFPSTQSLVHVMKFSLKTVQKIMSAQHQPIVKSQKTSNSFKKVQIHYRYLLPVTAGDIDFKNNKVLEEMISFKSFTEKVRINFLQLPPIFQQHHLTNSNNRVSLI